MQASLSKTSLNIAELEEEKKRWEICLIQYICQIMNLPEVTSVREICTPNIIAKLVFTIDHEKFSDIILGEKSLQEIMSSLKDFMKSKGLGMNIASNMEALQSGDTDECIDFMFDLIAMVKTFNREQFTYYEDLLEEDLKIYLNKIVSYSEMQLKEQINRTTTTKSLTSQNHLEMQKEMEEKMILKQEFNRLEETKKKIEDEKKEMLKEIYALRDELKNQAERYKLLEIEVLEKNKEYIEEFDKREEIHEQMKRYEIELKSYKEACSHYAIEEENFERMMMEKDKKIKKYLREIEDHEKTINIYELQMKELAKVTNQYKNEKEEFIRRKEIVSILKKNNHDKNQMLYYFSHKNYQLEVEKQKLDQYIKLCQYQIQKLTTDNKSLKHENQVLKTLNQNLLELGGSGSVANSQAGSIGLSTEGKYSSKFVKILKENIRVSEFLHLSL